MTRPNPTSSLLARSGFAIGTAAVLAAVPLSLAGCDKDTSTSKSTTTKTTVTPEGVKKTTETTEKKVEVEKKTPPPMNP